MKGLSLSFSLQNKFHQWYSCIKKWLAASLSFISYLISWNKSHWLSSRRSFVCYSVCFVSFAAAWLCLFLHAGHRGKPVQWEVGISSPVSDRNICPGGVAWGWVSSGEGDYSVFVRASHPTRPPAMEQTFFGREFVSSHMVICGLHLFIDLFS